MHSSRSNYRILVSLAVMLWNQASDAQGVQVVPSSPEAFKSAQFSAGSAAQTTPYEPPVINYACPMDQKLVGASCYQCDFSRLIVYGLTFEAWSNHQRDYNGSLPLSEVFKVESYPNSVSDRLVSIANQAVVDCRKVWVGIDEAEIDRILNEQAADDCIFEAIKNTLIDDLTRSIALANPSLTHNEVSSKAIARWYELLNLGCNTSTGSCASAPVKRICYSPNSCAQVTEADVYFNKSGTQITPAEAHDGVSRGELSCDVGALSVAISPISLEWDVSSTDEESVTVTRFDVGNADKKGWNTWKGSEKRPLLVWDPEHGGNVTGANQLFGNFTFGDKHAALASNGTFDDVQLRHPVLWENGFQALATLDANSDGEISGAELDPVALWFDSGSDGVSNFGEVVSARDAGLKKLFYSTEGAEKIGKDIKVARGFVRSNPAGEVTGSATDWFSYSASTPEAALHANFLDRPKNSKQTVERSKQELRIATSSKLSHEHLKKLRGAWRWSFKDALESKGGLISINPSSDGVLRGHLYTSFKFRDEYQPASAMLMVRSLIGEVIESSGDKVTISFISSDREGTSLTSIVKIDLGANNPRGTGRTNASAEWTGGRKLATTYEWNILKIDPR